jgi:hypothetical protein
MEDIMLDGLDGFAKIKGKWYSVKFRDGKVRGKKVLTGRLRDAKEGMVSFNAFLLKAKAVDRKEAVLQKYKIENAYINGEAPVDEPEGAEGKFAARWWKKLNKFCLGCQKTCKQPWKIDVIRCPSYIKI